MGGKEIAPAPAKSGAVVPKDRLSMVLATPQIKERFESMLGEKRAAAFMSSIISAVSGNAYLKKCDPMSVVSSAAIAASMDLPINPSLGFAHIVPYKDVAQFQMGWKGFVQLALRSGQYQTINVTTVKDGQLVDHDPFTGLMKFQKEAKSENIIGYLLYYRLLNGFEKYFYMTREEMEVHAKRYSASYKKNSGQWVENFDAMGMKTVAKLGLSKYGVLSVEMQRAIEADQAVIAEDGSFTHVDGGEAEDTKPEPVSAAPKKSRLEAAIEDAVVVPPQATMGPENRPPSDEPPPPGDENLPI